MISGVRTFDRKSEVAKSMDHRPSLDAEAARRQTIGLAFEPRKTDRHVAETILAGTLELKPHPAWGLPTKIEWSENPYEQPNWRAQLQMLRWLDPIRRIAAEGDQAALGFWLRTVRSWSDANPSDGGAASDYAWADMVEAVRALELVFAFPLVPPEEEGWLADLIWEHGIWLADPSHLGKANHALHQHEALFVIGTVFHHQSWIELSRDRLIQLFEASYDEEGVNAEGALAYHVNNYLWWNVAFQRLKLEGVELPASAGRLKLALNEIVNATRPDGSIERIGDTGGSNAVPIHRLRSPEMDYVRSEGAYGRVPPDLSKVYARGYVFGRSGWGAQGRAFNKEAFYSLSFGPGNRIHGHRDGGSLTLHSNGHPWLVDAGKYAYKVDPMTDYCRSRIGHNAVHIEDREHDGAGVVELISHTLSNDVDDFTFVDNSYEGVEITRRFTYCRGGDFVVLTDTVLSPSEVTATQRWHLDPETKLETIRHGFRLDREEAEARILWSGTLPELSVVRGETEPYDGWVATDWMKKQPAPVIKATKSGHRFRFITIIAVGSGTFSLDRVAAEGDGILVSATVDQSQFNVVVSKDRVAVSLGEQTADQVFLPLQQRLELAIIKAQKLRTSALVNLAVVDLFTPEAWAQMRKAVLWAKDVREARLEAIVMLFQILLADLEASPDWGLRAALLDLAGADIGQEIGLNAAVLGINREPLISWPQSTPTVSSKYKASVRTIETLEDLHVQREGNGIFTLPIGGLLLPMFIGRGSGDVLSVRFHGAINRSKTSLPLFQGIGAETSSGSNFLIFQDPTLDLDGDMTLSWYLGGRGANLYEEMARCIQRVQTQVGCSSVLLTGTSGGGYVALQVASFLREAVALVFAPQTDILSYYEQNRTEAITACFGSREALDEDPEGRVRTSLLARYSQLNDLPLVIYVQNIQDVHHVENHERPFAIFLESFPADQSERINFVQVDWGPGHIALTRERYEEHRAIALAVLSDRVGTFGSSHLGLPELM